MEYAHNREVITRSMRNLQKKGQNLAPFSYFSFLFLII